MQALLWHRGMLITTNAKPTRNSWNAHHISIVPELDTSNNKHITTTIWRGNSLLSFTVLTEWQQLTTNLNSKRWANWLFTVFLQDFSTSHHNMGKWHISLFFLFWTTDSHNHKHPQDSISSPTQQKIHSQT